MNNINIVINMVIIKCKFNIPDKIMEYKDEKSGRRLWYEVQNHICVVYLDSDDYEWACNVLENELKIYNPNIQIRLIIHRKGQCPHAEDWKAHDYKKIVKSLNGWIQENVSNNECKELYEQFIIKK